MGKIKRFIYKYQIAIMIISLVLMITGCCIVGICDLNPLWYALCFVVGLGVLIPFTEIVVMYLIVAPIQKLVEWIKNKKR